MLYEKCQQKSIAQSAVIDNQQKVMLYTCTLYTHLYEFFSCIGSRKCWYTNNPAIWMQELNDLKREAPGLRGALTKQHTEMQQVARQRDELLGDLEAYKQTVSLV